MGYTEEDVQKLCRLGYSKWIENQMIIPSTKLQPYIEHLKTRASTDSLIDREQFAYHKIDSKYTNVSYMNLSTAWMRAVLSKNDMLRQRVAWALSQILVVSNKINVRTDAAANYYDLLLDHSFGYYSDLLFEITKHPMMGHFLSYLGNRKAQPNKNIYPDENYAREIMQLFTIGLWQLNQNGTLRIDSKEMPLPTYDNNDIKELARVFTGFTLEGENFGTINNKKFALPMVIIDKHHDNGEKLILKQSIVSDSFLNSQDEVLYVIKMLVNHPNTAPFISKKLINHLVTSNPSDEYVKRVANVWRKSSGHLGSVIMSILMDNEALKPIDDFESGRLKDPMLRLTNLLIGFNCGGDLGFDAEAYPGLQWWHPDPMDHLSQSPLRSPSVFNFYDAEYSRPGTISDRGMSSPEFELYNDFTFVNIANYMYNGIDKGFHQPRLLNTKFRRTLQSPGEPLLCNFEKYNNITPNDLLKISELLLVGRELSEETRNRIMASSCKNCSTTERTKEIIYLVSLSSDAAIQR